MVDQRVKLVFSTVCLSAGLVILGRLPPVDSPQAAAVLAATVAFFVGIPLSIYGKELAESEANLLRKIFKKHPDPTEYEVLTVRCFGAALITVGMAVSWMVQ